MPALVAARVVDQALELVPGAAGIEVLVAWCMRTPWAARSSMVSPMPVGGPGKGGVTCCCVTCCCVTSYV